MELKEILFKSVAMEFAEYAKAVQEKDHEEQTRHYMKHNALWNVIEEAGLAEEYYDGSWAEKAVNELKEAC